MGEAGPPTEKTYHVDALIQIRVFLIFFSRML